MTQLPLPTLFSVFTEPRIYIYIQRLHLLHARCSQAKHVRDSEELIHHILGSPNLAAAVKPRGPSSAAKSSRESAARGKKVGWQRASFQIQRDFVTPWRRRAAGRGRWNEEEKGSGRKGRANEPSFPFVATFSLSLARHARAPIVPRSADRFDCRPFIVALRAWRDAARTPPRSNTFCLSRWLWATADECRIDRLINLVAFRKGWAIVKINYCETKAAFKARVRKTFRFSV